MCQALWCCVIFGLIRNFWNLKFCRSGCDVATAGREVRTILQYQTSYFFAVIHILKNGNQEFGPQKHYEQPGPGILQKTAAPPRSPRQPPTPPVFILEQRFDPIPLRSHWERRHIYTFGYGGSEKTLKRHPLATNPPRPPTWLLLIEGVKVLTLFWVWTFLESCLCRKPYITFMHDTVWNLCVKRKLFFWFTQIELTHVQD